MTKPPPELIRRLERVMSPVEMNEWLIAWSHAVEHNKPPPATPTWALAAPRPSNDFTKNKSNI